MLNISENMGQTINAALFWMFFTNPLNVCYLFSRCVESRTVSGRHVLSKTYIENDAAGT